MESGVPVSRERCSKERCPKGSLIFFGLAVVAVVIIAPLCIYYYVTHPSVPTFGVKSATLISPKITSSRLVAKLDIVFNVTNHNYWNKVYYNNVSISLNNNNMNNQSIIASTYLEPFSIKKRGLHSKTVDKEAQLNMDVKHDEKTDFIARGLYYATVDFEIVVSTNVKFKSIFRNKVNKSLKVVCNPLSMILDHPGSSNWVLVHGLTCTTCLL